MNLLHVENFALLRALRVLVLGRHLLIVRAGHARAPPRNARSFLASSESVVDAEDRAVNALGIVRSDVRLGYAEREISKTSVYLDNLIDNFRLTADLLELRNLTTACRLIVECAIKRKESRGLHFNKDCPELDDSQEPQNTIVLNPDV